MRPTPTFELISNASSISDKIIELRNIKLDSLKKK